MALFPESATSGPSSSPRRNRCGASSRNTWTVERPRNLRTTRSDIELLGRDLDCLTNQWHPHVGGHFFQNDPYVGRLAGNKVSMLKGPGSARAAHEPIERATARLLTCQRLQLPGQSYFRLQRTFKEERSCSLAVISAGFVEWSLPCFVAVHAFQAWQWMEDTNPATFATRRAVSAAYPPDAPGSEAHPRQ